jgi:hypothetical protein
MVRQTRLFEMAQQTAKPVQAPSVVLFTFLPQRKRYTFVTASSGPSSIVLHSDRHKTSLQYRVRIFLTLVTVRVMVYTGLSGVMELLIKLHVSWILMAVVGHCSFNSYTVSKKMPWLVSTATLNALIEVHGSLAGALCNEVISNC